MPIIDIEIVGEDGRADAARLANALSTAIGAPAGTLWVRLRRLAPADYAENGPPPEPTPVFVRVLSKSIDAASVPLVASKLCGAVAAAVGRPADVVHVIFEPDAGGRVFFGGRPEPR